MPQGLVDGIYLAYLLVRVDAIKRDDLGVKVLRFWDFGLGVHRRVLHGLERIVPVLED